MPSRTYVRPCKGRSVPDPYQGYMLIPRTGRWVTKTDYWVRRLNDRDVVECTPPGENPASDEKKLTLGD